MYNIKESDQECIVVELSTQYCRKKNLGFIWDLKTTIRTMNLGEYVFRIFFYF